MATMEYKGYVAFCAVRGEDPDKPRRSKITSV
jgi:hypothetical protein